jgi:hypothetical protein
MERKCQLEALAQEATIMLAHGVELDAKTLPTVFSRWNFLARVEKVVGNESQPDLGLARPQPQRLLWYTGMASSREKREAGRNFTKIWTLGCYSQSSLQMRLMESKSLHQPLLSMIEMVVHIAARMEKLRSTGTVTIVILQLLEQLTPHRGDAPADRHAAQIPC